MRLILLILILVSALWATIARLFGLTGLRQMVNEVRGVPAQTRYTKLRYTKIRSR